MKKTSSLVSIYSVLISIIFLLSAAFPLPVSANSAQAHWTGTTATGAIVTNDTCPIIVESEILTFDIQEFPKQYYGNVHDYLSYTGKVTAEYTFHNPADYMVEATLLFPFGTVPDYGILLDPKTDERLFAADTEKYNITVNGTAIEKTLRHTLSLHHSQFDLERDMALLYNGYLTDTFYSPDTPVTQYTYIAQNVDTQKYTAANAAWIVSSDPSKTKVFMENENGGTLLDNGTQLECWVQDQPFVVNVIGEPLSQMPEWTFYENGACDKKINGTMTLIRTDVITLKDLVLSEYKEESQISEQDWYNAAITFMKQSEREFGVISASEFQLDLSTNLMRWYEYTITLKPGETIVNTVTAPIYPSFHTTYEPPIYEYIYLLSPAKSWKQFGPISVIVNTPYYMTESGPEAFEHTNNRYTCHFTGLPEEELTFTLCQESDPTAPSHTLSMFSPIFMIAVLLLLIVGVCILMRKNNTNTK